MTDKLRTAAWMPPRPMAEIAAALVSTADRPFGAPADVTIDLPLGPGVNGMYANRKRGAGFGRIKTKKYRAWITEAGWQIRIQRPMPVHGPVTIQLILPETMRGDGDGRLKAPIDILVTHHIIDGDDRKIVREVAVKFSSEIDGCRVVIRPSE